MTLRFTKNFLPVIFFALILWALAGCKNKRNRHEFSYNCSGYWWKLLSFSTDTFSYRPGNVAWISASFKTQKDSVFYDSPHDLRDRFFIKVDSFAQDNLLKNLISRSSEGDSLCMLVKPSVFFRQQFNKQVPFFSGNDSVVKIYMKVKKILSGAEFASLAKNILNNESKEIESYFGSAEKKESALDSLGFYWVQKPDEAFENIQANQHNSACIRAGDQITIAYRGSFLNGRVIDSSPKNFQLVYGTPDQLVKGLNYVICRLKLGQNSKIILPSHLAFGENGSSNGSVPPFTPMLYELSITEIKPKNE